ncbi:uncharacterized protein N0V89_012482 [Didymosphaeria variabile]|uniref:Uncharacterized protein n=1 Tax=Didymosphaeria variabile TaxID=1932322 RepID=A0A9W8X9C1_9PLEO|nr:uncharacterized protein N0V89_012482 [Didymosphaeria variabile]KAJ4344738.1 hypothetical protein N0V89_012482 [Didymosphaeria variabile]
MPPKRRVIDVDVDDSDIIEIHSTSLTAPRPPKNPRTMPPGANSVQGSSAPRPASGVATPAFPNKFFTLSIGTNSTASLFFPDRTLATIAELRQLEIHAVMEAFQTNVPINPHYRYTMTSDTAVGSATDFSSLPVGQSTPSLSFANARLLHQFLARNSRLAEKNEKPKFVLLAPIKGVKNPKFAHLHAVRYDEVGCGFDEDNCLSLFVSELVEGERHTKVLYVERTKVEVIKEAKVPTVVEGVKAEGGS